MSRFEILTMGLMLLLASALPASAAGFENVSKIICQGEGKASAVPDLVIVTIGVETRNISAAAAAAENAVLMSSTKKALLEAGIKEEDVQTSYYSLAREPEDEMLDRGEKMPKKPLEFIATNRVTVKMNASGDIGKVLDAAIEAGSNNILGISFDLRDPKPEMDKALFKAVEDARRKAEVIALAAGAKLGRVLEISEGYSFVSPQASRAAYAFDASTPIQLGQMEVTASVTLTYEIA